MSVYKEGYHIVDMIKSRSRQIWPDAADYGVLVRKDDEIFCAAKQLADSYGIKDSRVVEDYSTGKSVRIKVVLMDEWAVSDERKTKEQATDYFYLDYVTVSDRKLNREGYIGIVTVFEM